MDSPRSGLCVPGRSELAALIAVTHAASLASRNGLRTIKLAIGLLMLLYMVAGVGDNLAGTVGLVIVVTAFLAEEASLWKTR